MPSFMLPCSLFWQVNRIEEMTSVIPSMLTTACWIRRPMNAGRSLLLTHSGTIGTTSTCFKIKLLPNSYQNPMEIRKLVCFAVIPLISMKQRRSDNFLKQRPQPRSAFSMSYFYVKNPCSFCCILSHRTSILFSHKKVNFVGFFFFFLTWLSVKYILVLYASQSETRGDASQHAEGCHHIIYLCLRFVNKKLETQEKTMYSLIELYFTV